ncbi:MAG: hypothetical protein MJ131_01595 [Lachnospiraceae bacterium]|nr:hypothetical protein [Lachnospiraceae bacterium]
MKRIIKLSIGFLMFFMIFLIGLKVNFANAKQSVPSLTVRYGDIWDLEPGSRKSFSFSYDFNGDKKADKATFTFECLENDEILPRYKLTAKINNKSIMSEEVIFYYQSGSMVFTVFDLNPGDKYSELMIRDETHDDPGSYGPYYIYRYDGKTGKLMHKFGTYKGYWVETAKQKNNDKLQVNVCVDVAGVGLLNIYGDMKLASSGEDILLRASDGVYKVKNSSYASYEFLSSKPIYKTAACKIKIATTKKYDTGLVTKLKTRKSDNRPTHIYVEMDNGKKGWIKLPASFGGEYFLSGGILAG